MHEALHTAYLQHEARGLGGMSAHRASRARASTRQHTSAYVSIRQHTSAHTCSVRREGLAACRQTAVELERGEVSRSRSRKSPDAILSALDFKFKVGTGGTLAGGGAGAGGPGGVGVPGGIAGSTRGQRER